MKPYLDYDGLAVLAHRGGVEESYENTLESFQYSQSIGCEFIETDVQVSADGVPYIFHDKDLKRILDLDKRFTIFSSYISTFNYMKLIIWTMHAVLGLKIKFTSRHECKERN